MVRAGAKSVSVWRVNGKTIEKVAVETGLTDGTWTEVRGGSLNVEDRVVTSLAAVASASAKTTTTRTATSNPLLGTGMGGPPPGPPR